MNFKTYIEILEEDTFRYIAGYSVEGQFEWQRKYMLSFEMKMS